MIRFYGLCLTLMMTLTVYAQQTAPKASIPETRLFGIILVQGSSSPIKDNQELTPKTQKVLDEVADFLPFKYFSMLDSSFIRTNNAAQFKLRGPAGTELIAEMRIHPHPDKENSVIVRAFEILEDTFDHNGEKKVRYTKQHIVTSFSIEIGETIVVGTSRINDGHDSIIVLFSAG